MIMGTFRARGERIARIGSAFAWGALFVALYDFARAAFAPAADAESMGDLLRLAPRSLVLCPALLSLASMALAFLIDIVSKRLGDGRAGRILVVVVASSPALPFLVPLFSGPRIASSPLRLPLLGVAFLAAIAAVATWIRLLACGDRRLSGATGTARILGPLAALVAPWIGIVALGAATTRVFPGLYEPAHALASLAAVSLCASGVWVAFAGWSGLASLRGCLVLVLAFTVLGGGMSVALATGAPLGRQLLAESAPFSAPFQGALNRAEDEVAWWSAEMADESASTSRGSVHRRVRFRPFSEKRSVLLVTIDALRADALEPGSRLAASDPALVALGSRSLTFSRAYSPGNRTPIAIPAIVLGGTPGGADAPDLRDSLVSPFSRAGYETHFFFTSHEYASLERTPLWPLASRGFGFQRYHRENRPASEILDSAAAALAGAKGPTFVWAHLSDLHFPFPFHSGRGASIGQGYPRVLAELDGVLAGFIDRLARGRSDVVWALSSDHGESLGERGQLFHGTSLFDEQIRVPIYLGGPGTNPGRVARPVSLTALGATLAVLAGAEAERDVPLLPTEPDAATEGFAPVLSVGVDVCAWIRYPYKLIADRGRGTLALYDLERDPAELRNLISERREVGRRLLEELRRGGCPCGVGSLASQVGP